MATREFTRKERREIQQKSAKLLAMPAGKFVPIPIDTAPPWMTRAFRNNHFVVMINDYSPTSKGPGIRAMVQRHDGNPIPGHWKAMQDIKNEIFGAETMAVEYYPRVSELVDTKNIYWMWIFPDGVLPEPMLRG